jgi:hypothetical protein
MSARDHQKSTEVVVGGHVRPAAVTGRCRVVLAGSLSCAARAALGDRFAGTTVTRHDSTTEVEVVCVDQPAVRAVLTLLWDLGHDVLSLDRDPLRPS